MDLSTQYLGFTLSNPLVPGASPLTDNMDNVRRLEDAGAPMIVMRSLFAEQISDIPVRWFMDPFRSMSQAEPFALTPDQYLAHVQRIRKAVASGIPIVASLNVTEAGAWLDFAKQVEEAGANALELNIYSIVGDIDCKAERVEQRTLAIIKLVKRMIKIPIAVKLYPFYTSLPNFVNQLAKAGADGVVLFNRSFQPDVDIEGRTEEPLLTLSNSSELPLRLRAIAMLHARVATNLAITGGIHDATDAIKGMMCGADALQVVSALLKNGVGHLATLRQGMAQWLEKHEYQSLREICGSMSLYHFSDPSEFERKYYIQILQRWQD